MLVLYNPESEYCFMRWLNEILTKFSPSSSVYNDLTSDDNLSRSGSPTPQNSSRTMGRTVMPSVSKSAAISPITPKEFTDSLEHPSMKMVILVL
jgi:hypothetical protein